MDRQRVSRTLMNPAVRIAVIMPVLDEVTTIARSVAAVLADASRCVVVDGGSTDGTPEAAASAGATTLTAPRGRASQMNAGLTAAGACEVVLFLHADATLPEGWAAAIASVVAKGARWGRFDVTLDSVRPTLRVVGAMMNLRSRLTGICTGDQAIFVAREVLDRLGGFAPLPLMEDIELSARLKREAGSPACLRERVSVSARRWEKHGVWRTIVQMWWIRLLYFAGVSPQRLHEMYYGRPPPANDPGRVVIVLARAPVLGAVKTRLAATIGAQAALDAYRRLLERTLARVAPVQAQRWLCLDAEGWSSATHPEIRELATRFGLQLSRQSSGDLGVRMQRAMAPSLARGARVVLVGADCPILEPADIERAFAALERCDAVFAPAEDGGYALVGLARAAPELFEAIAWSTSDVMAQTRQRLAAHGLVWEELRTLWDVDTQVDLQRWQAMCEDKIPIEPGP